MREGSALAGLCGTRQERTTCSYGLNPQYQQAVDDGGLHLVGSDETGEARAFELPGHPFYVGTLYLPQLSSASGAPHPVLAAFVDATRPVP